MGLIVLLNLSCVSLCPQAAVETLKQRGMSDGLFLIRPNSRKAGSYALTLVYKQTPYHYEVVCEVCPLVGVVHPPSHLLSLWLAVLQAALPLSYDSVLYFVYMCYYHNTLYHNLWCTHMCAQKPLTHTYTHEHTCTLTQTHTVGLLVLH